VVTSTNAKQIVESFPKDEKIIFGPDRNLGNYINSITGRNMLLWDGACHVHEEFSVEKIVEIKQQHPDAVVLAHPECKSTVLKLADVVGSFAEVRSGTSRKELHCSYRKRYPARDAETMPADNIYSGSSQRQHLCLQ
jgi:quinolinate synthetase A subunit